MPSPAASPAASAPGVATAVQATADQFTQIDHQVAAAQDVSVDASLLPTLATHITTLDASLAGWTSTVRPSAVQALQHAFSLDETAVASWPVDSNDTSALTAFASSLKQAVTGSLTEMQQVARLVVPLRQAVDTSLSALQSDAQAVSAQLEADQDALDELDDEIEDDEEAKEEYDENPMRYLMEGGVDIGSVLTQLTTLLASESDQQAAVKRAQSTLDAISQLSAAGGALTSLSTTLGALGTSLVDTQTAVAQVTNTLSGIIAEPPLPPILAAQLDSMVTDLKTADGIVTSLTQTS